MSALPAVAQPQPQPQPAAVVTNQTPSIEDFKPSSSNQQGKQYPQVNSERRVRARVVAPQAQIVQLDLGGVKYPLTKGDGGAWTGDSRPQDEGFHYYQIVVDGAQVPDPNSLYYYGASRWGSGIEIPARIRTFTPSRACRTGSCGRSTISPSPVIPIIRCDTPTFTLRRTMIRIRPCAIRCFIYSMVRVRTKPAGATKAMPA